MCSPQKGRQSFQEFVHPQPPPEFSGAVRRDGERGWGWGWFLEALGRQTSSLASSGSTLLAVLLSGTGGTLSFRGFCHYSVLWKVL